jgi:S1-C subfamily serine protease
MSAHAHLTRRHRSRRALVAALVALPLVAVPVAAPAIAVATTVDARGYGLIDSPWGGGYGGFGNVFGERGGFGGQSWSVDPSQLAPATGTTRTSQDATRASNAESTGVVLIDTTLDYGQGEAAGSGLVLTSDGTVVTNHHVVKGATSITVTVPSTGKKYAATVVGYNASRDVAVLKLEGASGLATVPTDTTVAVGEPVTAVGNAEGGGVLTAADGKVLVRRTTIDVSDDNGGTEHLKGLIESSADVVSGDSGGALLDADGEAIGMNVAASSGTAQVTGYAIPISRVLRIADKIVGGHATASITIGSRAALGVELDTSGGAPYVAGVVSGGAADKAGIAAGDTITSVGGTAVDSYSALTKALSGYRAGQQVVVGWADASGAPHTATVTLGTAPVA